MFCIFCEIAAKRIPAQVIYEDERCMAFMDLMPINPGHVLIIPKEHAANIWELPPAAAQALLPAAQKVAAALRSSGLRCEGVNLHMANGEVAGQSVFHAHLHVVPRFAGDGFGLKFPPGYGAEADKNELAAAAEQIRQALVKAR
ncbi:MAG TPA: HIT family protein [bacterium]|nr:HIT family protein [bacterium]HQI47605.1 HIT family protein [bacterium]HQJ64382.1 HIT family protein [bacterium]HQJ65494.1 HIT family protein [bacterium]